MNRILLWFMHPDRNSFNGAVMEVFKEELKSLGADVKVRFIHELELSPILTKEEYNDSLKGVYPETIQREHHYIEWAEMIVMVFPIWWGGFPAAGKGFLDRVLSYGFAYELEGETPIPQINGKKIGAIYTTGSPQETFVKSKDYIERTWEREIFQFCGFETLPFLHFGDVTQVSNETREKMLEEAKNYARRCVKNNNHSNR
ncbi:NAD(P)H dehydrogenase (quinone) [Salibacterium salarium]|uniref:NAD(P)H-dependent oxidoreductase n=1 Tax=Salibacterium salarium TaxID=284579 RepID=UPI002788327C|nr:NAD(P)H-dependent oxidoreductase [Salibacterium salarium]MDQ0298766.1 NAD(P)H dehydrogenase (quinone) [Salibacterium salarium]